MTSPQTLPTSQSEALFWKRQNSISAQYDHPQMLSSPSSPTHPHVELFVATPAGKPLYHFAYNGATPTAPTAARPSASIATLSAALTAFQAKTDGCVTVVQNGSSTLLVHVHDSLHMALLARHQPAPVSFLQALLRAALAAIQSSLSASLLVYLHEHPAARPSFATAEPLLRCVLRDALSHPLPYALVRPVALPSSAHPTTRLHLSQLVRLVLQRHSVFQHVVVWTTGPPFPAQVVTSCSPANAPLTALDVLLLSALPSPADADGDEHGDGDVTGRAFYAHAGGFGRKQMAYSRLVHLRLHPDHHDAFKRAVGGQMWRPEWTRSPPHTVRVVALGSAEADDSAAKRLFDDMEDALDRTHITTHLLVSLERPFHVAQFGVHGARAVLCLQHGHRLAGTVGAFAYPMSIAVLQALRDARNTQKSHLLDARASVARVATWAMCVVVWDRRFAVCFDSAVQDEQAVAATREVFAPWLQRYASSIIPEGERVSVHAHTPLAGLLAPFES